jgi:hypothetical protein
MATEPLPHYCPDCDDFHAVAGPCPNAQIVPWIAALGILAVLGMLAVALWRAVGR